MTNSVDVLCIGGPKHDTLVCFNKSEGLATEHEFQSIGGEPSITYTRRDWWHEGNERWYRIATHLDNEPSDAEIAIAIAAALFPPAWDLRSKPAPEPEVEE